MKVLTDPIPVLRSQLQGARRAGYRRQAERVPRQSLRKDLGLETSVGNEEVHASPELALVTRHAYRDPAERNTALHCSKKTRTSIPPDHGTCSCGQPGPLETAPAYFGKTECLPTLREGIPGIAANRRCKTILPSNPRISLPGAASGARYRAIRPE